jgi:diacylglycerol kinase family enzyme
MVGVDDKSEPVAPPEHTVAPDAPLFIVLNPGSGKHGDEDVRATIETTLNSAGRTYFLHEVDEPSQLQRIAHEAVSKARAQRGVVVAAGGDGTINTVAAATLGSACVFGVLPLGTFNYFGRTHGITSDVQAACQMLLTTRAFEVQVGLLNDRIFLVNGSIGLYPELLENREQAKRQLGRRRWVAILSALATLLQPHRLLRIDIETSRGKRSVSTPTLFVGNNRLQLVRVGIEEGQLVEHHRLVAVLVRPVGPLAMLALVWRAIWGRLGASEQVESFAFERITVRSRLGRRRFKVALDGEVDWMLAPLTFQVAPHPLLLLRPAEPGEDPG